MVAAKCPCRTANAPLCGDIPCAWLASTRSAASMHARVRRPPAAARARTKAARAWQVLDMRERTLGPEHPEVASALNNLAVLLRAVDKARALPYPLSPSAPIHYVAPAKPTDECARRLCQCLRMVAGCEAPEAARPAGSAHP